MVSFEKLAEKLNGKVWIKGDLKRIYLDRGHNTKKMSTKTWVEQQVDSFVVKCFVECPSQPWQWCKSQQEEVIESVENQIENIINQSNLELISFNINKETFDYVLVIKELSSDEIIEINDEDFLSKYGVSASELFGGKLEAKIEALYEKAREERVKEQEIKAKKQEEVKKQEFQETIIPAGAKRVKHGKFGLASVIEINEEKGQIKLKFDDQNVGVKTLLIRFAPLEILS
jgi:hypothetical protein